eukprot:1356811-Pleurochrysis_carterae.AAC.1
MAGGALARDGRERAARSGLEGHVTDACGCALLRPSVREAPPPSSQLFSLPTPSCPHLSNSSLPDDLLLAHSSSPLTHSLSLSLSMPVSPPSPPPIL